MIPRPYPCLIGRFAPVDRPKAEPMCVCKLLRHLADLCEGDPVDNPAVLALTPAEDGLSCVVSAVGPLSTATVTTKADADLGSGVTHIIGTVDVEITGGTAVTVQITPGAPTEQP